MKSKISRLVLSAFALAALLTSFWLTGCETVSSDPSASLRLYQPPVLRLSKGVQIQSRDGTYVPQVDEIWHSNARYSALEQQVIDLTAALAQERARR